MPYPWAVLAICLIEKPCAPSGYHTSPIGISGAVLALAARTDTTGVLTTIRVPTLILVGEHDKLTPPSASEYMQKQIAGSELHIISKAGHMTNLENAPDFNRHLIDFLNRMM